LLLIAVIAEIKTEKENLHAKKSAYGTCFFSIPDDPGFMEVQG
jgi:hypothetical protein